MPKKTKKAKNLLAQDPTRTLTLRKRAYGEINRRFSEIKTLIRKSVVTNKVFVDNAEPLDKEAFVFLRTPEKLEEFGDWLNSVINELILSGKVKDSLSPSELNWLIAYYHEAYIKGAKKANNEVASVIGRNQVPVLSDVMSVPAHFDKAQLLFIRGFDQLKGITESMSQQISYELSKGLLEGTGTRELARTLNDRVDKIGITRARLISRTEIINAHNLAKIIEGRRLQELLGVPIYARWQTRRDDRVRDVHEKRQNKYYTLGKVATLIGEPNCRCNIALVPATLLPEKAEVIN